MKLKPSRLARYAGLLTGCGLAAAVLWNGALPSNALAGSELPARITFTSEASELLSVKPSGTFISKQKVQRTPRRDAQGTFTVYNPAGADVRARFVTSEDIPLGALMQVSIRAGSEAVFTGDLEKFRRDGSASFVLADKATISIEVRAWLPPSADLTHQGRTFRVRLQIQGERLPK